MPLIMTDYGASRHPWLCLLALSLISYSTCIIIYLIKHPWAGLELALGALTVKVRNLGKNLSGAAPLVAKRFWPPGFEKAFFIVVKNQI